MNTVSATDEAKYCWRGTCLSLKTNAFRAAWKKLVLRWRQTHLALETNVFKTHLLCTLHLISTVLQCGKLRSEVSRIIVGFNYSQVID